MTILAGTFGKIYILSGLCEGLHVYQTCNSFFFLSPRTVIFKKDENNVYLIHHLLISLKIWFSPQSNDV